MNFNELKFEKIGFGIQSINHFPNGWGVSIIQSPYSFGGDVGMYEIAVLRDGEIHYDNKISNGDVIGWLTEEKVEEIISEVQSL